MRPLIPYAVQRRFFRLLWVLGHPRTARAYRRHWNARPRKPGDLVLAHGEVRIVTEIRDGDGLVLDGGEGCSWMNCCEPVPEDDLRRQA